jgi:hypothetical protein
MAEFRVTSTPVTLSIAGQVQEDPFGGYIDTWVEPTLPDDVLTPAMARELYSRNITLEPWDMAAGTSRWIIPNYTMPTPVDAETFAPVARGGWFGCSYDGVSGLTFPSESANLTLLDVSASIPSRIHLSFGWVVDGNPQVTFSVTNSSEYALPGFYGEPSHQLYLVHNGRVVAEAYPVSTNPNSPVAYMESARVAAPTEELAIDNVDSYWGILEPNTPLVGDFLWRDVTGCWSDSGQMAVAAGTYTVLSVQFLNLRSEVLTSTTTDATGMTTEGEATSTGFGEMVGLDTMVDPNSYPTYDWLELQMWTSLGTVTITTS